VNNASDTLCVGGCGGCFLGVGNGDLRIYKEGRHVMITKMEEEGIETKKIRWRWRKQGNSSSKTIKRTKGTQVDNATKEVDHIVCRFTLKWKHRSVTCV